MSPKEVLLEWVLAYVKAKCSLQHKSIEIIKDQGVDFIITCGESKDYYVIFPHLKDCEDVLKDVGEKKFFVVTFNTKENFNVLLELWKEIIVYSRLCIIFVNPEALGDKKWAVYPHTHNKITEKSVLKQGLRSLARQVEEWIDINTRKIG